MDPAVTSLQVVGTMEQGDRHPVVSFLSAFFWVILYLLSWVKSLIAFATITVPRLIYSALSYSMTLTLNFWSFAIIFAASAVALNYWIRFRYLNTYAQLKEPPLMKPDAQELHPDVNSTEPPPAFHNYLDEFLQAVRVFGFLEKPVFHELARHLQTRRLIAGDSLSLDQDKNFYCVVDGMVQVYAPSGKSAESQGGVWDNEDMNGYELMNEVGSGGTLSSLFTILSLFTEHVKMSWQNDDVVSMDDPTTTDGIPARPSVPRNRAKRADSDVSRFDLDFPTRSRSRSPSLSSSVSSSGSTIHAPDSVPIPDIPSSPSQRTDTTNPSTPQQRPHGKIHHGTVARATEDTTLAVIPAEAFRRVTKKFPKATAHIVQVIMTRFYRVTFNAAHKYLGLTTEVLRTEKAINDLACHPLPPKFYEGGGMEQLRQRFDRAGDTSPSDGTHFSSNSSSTMLSGKTAVDPNFLTVRLTESPASRPNDPPRGLTRMPNRSARHLVQAGDLLSSTDTTSDAYSSSARMHSVLNTPKIPRRDLSGDVFDTEFLKQPSYLNGDDFDLREAVMNCVAMSIGLLQPPMSGDVSVEASPAFSPISPSGQLSRAAAFNSSFGSLSLLDMPDDSSSMTGGSSTKTANAYMKGLDNEVEILFFSAGSYLARAGERDIGLFYVIDGFLDILLPSKDAPKKPKANPSPMSPNTIYNSETFPPDRGSTAWSTTSERSGRRETPDIGGAPRAPQGRQPLFTVKPGGIAGYLASLSDTASYVDIVAKTDTYVGFLPHHALERLLEKQPIVLLTLAKRLISLLSPLVLQIDASLDWMQVNAGQVLWRTGDVSDSFYIVINGRLRAITEKEQGGVNIVAEYGQGDTAGEIDVITSTPRKNTVHAIRDTELIRMPQTLFNAISSRNPQTTALLLRMIASRVRSDLDSAPNPRSWNPQLELRRNNANLKTVAILPVSRHIPVDAFARKLHSALEGIGASTSFLNQALVSTTLGRHAFTRVGKLKTAAWLADQEQRYKIVLYVVDSAVNNSWTQTCIRQADFVMVVGMGDDPSIGEYERLLLSMKTTARKELVLLHPDRSVYPGSTQPAMGPPTSARRVTGWSRLPLVLVPFPSRFLVQGLKLPVTKPTPTLQDPAAVAALKNLKDKVQSEIQKYRGGRSDVRTQRPAHSNDFARLARRICGTSIGVVLGGGGARGISHIGVLRALEEFSTSIGAFIGGLYAREGDIISTAGRAKQFSARMGNIWRLLSDVTYPLVAYTTGHEFNRSIYKAFYDLHIEDMWLPFFCNSANINASRMEIHETGYAWRFIRASMTLVGLLPPLCDNGNMLVDGGYLDNLPVSAMFDMGASAVFASDVGSIDDNSPRNFGDTVSGWWLLINRLNPFSNAKSIPAITEIQSRLAYVSSVRTLEDAKIAPGCLYMALPVQEFGTLQFGKFEEIHEKGYIAAMAMIEKWDEEERLPSGYIDGTEAIMKRKKKGRSARRNSI
ncbi:hypothetical protein EVG20_g1831 [Dentipellis fragilis]|uniref:Lysophospholipase NTE1 n=1 Tax=Dentipellis fragilis TaxID=205917 RepID=A0A4Y9ZB08_9AGAM|nr:hypothetical protein EVG20_g1831 [Dentipellis fragilis]